MATRDRPSDDRFARRARLAQEVRDAAAADGALLIPAFAVERTQELIVDLVDLMERGEDPDSAGVSRISPLAIRATEVFRRARGESRSGVDLDRLLNSPQLRFTETVDESKSIARLSGFHIVIAASGMCDAGRIRHHLKRWLWNGARLPCCWSASRRKARWADSFTMAQRPCVSRARRSRSRRESVPSTNIPAMPTAPNWHAGCLAASDSSRRVYHSWRGARTQGSRRTDRRANNSDGQDLQSDARRHLRASTAAPTPLDVGAPAQAGSRCGRQSRLAQRHVQAAPRHQ